MGLKLALAPVAAEESERDFTTWDSYLGDIPLMYSNEPDIKQATGGLPTRPVRQDTGNNPNQIRPESGDIFSQGDFSHGAGQEKYHDPDSDPSRYYHSEGIDIFTVGQVKNLFDVDTASGVTSPGVLEQVGGELFSSDGVNVKRTTDLSSWTTENPHNGEGDVAVLDLAASGAKLLAAVGVNGLHERSSGAAWAHYQIAAANVEPPAGQRTVTKVRWIRGRPFVVADDGRSVYDFTSTPPTPLRIGDRLEEGWTYEDLFVAGNYILLCAVNANAGLSFVRSLRLKSDLTGYEWVLDSPMPRNRLVYCGRWEFGKVYLGGGVKNRSGGMDPFLDQTSVDGDGGIFREFVLAQGEGAGALELPVKIIEPIGTGLLFGWSLGASSPFGSREGLAVVYPGRPAFAHHLALETTPGTVESVKDITIYKGKVVYATSDQLFHEDQTEYRDVATLITSIGNWHNTGRKAWDKVEIEHPALPDGTSIEVYYSTEHPKANQWTLAGSNQTADSKGATFYIDDVQSVALAVKILLRATSPPSVTPELTSFSVRSKDSPEKPEYQIVRHWLVLPKNQKPGGEVVYDDDPGGTARTLRKLRHSYQWLYEPGGDAFRVFMKDVAVDRILFPTYEETEGESRNEGWYVRAAMEATDESTATGAEIALV